MFLVYVLIAVGILLMMIVIHEYGHYVAGKALGFKITEFSIGFGPKVFGRTLKNGEKFSLRIIPLGGYCAFYDENGTEQTKEFKSFVDHAPYKRIIVLLSGVVFNFLSAIIFAFIFLSVVGYSVPTVQSLAIDPVTQSPYAEQLQVGDVVQSVNGKPLDIMYTWTDAMNTDTSDDAQFELIVVRIVDNQSTEISVTVRRKSIYNSSTGNSYKGLGFNAGNKQIKVSGWKAASNSLPLTLKFSGMILGSFGDMISGKAPISEMTGPISTVTGIAQSAVVNAQILLLMLPLIAANLAIFNLLPLPALDGSRIVFALIEWIRGKPINREVESVIHFVGFVVLVGGVILLEIVRVIT